MKPVFILLILAAANSVNVIFAQDDLMKIAMENTDKEKDKVIATFRTTKLICAQTNETVHKRTLDFRVGHLFGNVGKKSNGGGHTFYGLDASADIRIAFEYGITDQLTIGLSRSKRQENFEGLIKYRLLEQTTDNRMPLAITFFANAGYTAISNSQKLFQNSTDRLSYTSQLIFARKFSSHVSFEILPTLVHRNFVFSAIDNNTMFALGAGGRVKVTKSTCVIADYFYNFDEMRKIDNEFGYYNALGIGVEIETGGHVFTIMFTNASGIIENDFLPNTTDTWSKGGFKFSFNISRNFKI